MLSERAAHVHVVASVQPLQLARFEHENDIVLGRPDLDIDRRVPGIVDALPPGTRHEDEIVVARAERVDGKGPSSATGTTVGRSPIAMRYFASPRGFPSVSTATPLSEGKYETGISVGRRTLNPAAERLG